MKIAIIGTGISGLVSAYLLSQEHEVTVFEANDYIGGHTNTLEVEANGEKHRIDTGFIVYNERNYPNFTKLLGILGVPTESSNMSFSVRCDETGLEYNGTSLASLFAQKRNLLRPAFWRMLRDILHFYRTSPEITREFDYTVGLGEYLESQNYSKEFIDWHMIPMGCAIWSTGVHRIREFPIRHFVNFFNNHDFLRVSNRTGWRIIQNGSSSYIPALTRSFAERIRLQTPVLSLRRKPDGVSVQTKAGRQEFEQVVLATHSDQALRLLSDPTEREVEILGKIKYQANEVVLHTDERLLPNRPSARASWNYHIPSLRGDLPSVTYYMNSLQNLRSDTHFCVTLNRTEAIDPSTILKRMVYDHPVFTPETITAQNRKLEISGVNRTFYCGAYWGYGFHEDGVVSALEVANHFGKSLRSAA